MAGEVLWLNKWTFRVRHPNGRATDVTLVGADRMGRNRLANLVAWQTEETLAELAGPEPISPPHSKAFQHDLGKVLKAIEETNKLVAATGHGRYY